MDNGKLITELTKDELHNQLNKTVDFEVSDTNKAKKLLETIGLKIDNDYKLIKQTNTIKLYTNLNLRAKINELFVKSGINVLKMNLSEENLEDFFTRMITSELKLNP